MASCAHCKTFILFGGIREGKKRYCNEHCQRASIAKEAEILLRSECEHSVVDDGFIQAEAAALHGGCCPICDEQGPVDLHICSGVISAVYYYKVEHTTRICCESCARKANIKASIISLFFGWWSIPGLIYTPVLLVRNLWAYAVMPDPLVPSDRLVHMLKKRAVEQMVARRRQQEQQQEEQTGSLS